MVLCRLLQRLDLLDASQGLSHNAGCAVPLLVTR